MKVWYKAVCDEHKEMCDVLVHDTYRIIPTYLVDEAVVQWLQAHLGCKLRLIHSDEDLDECFDKGYEKTKS